MLVAKIVEAIRLLSVVRAGAVKARTAALQQLDDLIITARQQLRGELRRAKTLRARAALCLKLRADGSRLQEPLHAASGAAPIQASSGRTSRHRLDFGGDRQANRALHMIAVCRLRHCERTRAYAARRAQDGLNRREILRCLKRYIARETYHTLRTDLAGLVPGATATGTVTISCGAGPNGITHRRA